MDKALLTALKLFFVLSVLFLIGYWAYIIYDETDRVTRYGIRVEILVLWLLYSIVYLAGFSFVYWVLAFAVILVYYKIVLRFKQHQCDIGDNS